MNPSDGPAAAPRFDPERYKQTTREQWDSAAVAWHRWGPTLAEWLGPATERMLTLAGVSPGHRVLDVAAGAGSQTIAAARRVGPGGHVLATDLSPEILRHAASEARREGLANVETRVLDGEKLDVPAGSFDAVISRVGLIYFPDRVKALRGMHRALRPGGTVSNVVYSTAERNAFFSVPVSIIRRLANLPPPAAGQPGPFSLAAPGVIEAAYREAGFTDVRVEVVSCPLLLPSAAECVRFEQESFGALHQMLSALSDADREAAWGEITVELGKFEGPSGFEGPCEMLVAVGTK